MPRPIASEPAFLDTDWQTVLLVLADSVEGFDATLRSLEANSVGSNRLVLAQDAEPVREALDGYTGRIQWVSLPPLSTERYWAPVIAAFSPETTRTLFVASGARVPPDWDARLVAAAQASPQSAVLSPLLASHPQASAFNGPTASPSLSVDDVDQWVNDYASDAFFPLPCLPRTCVLFQGEVWQTAAKDADDTTLVSHIKSHGDWLSATGQLYVDDSRCPGAAAAQVALNGAVAQAYSERHPLASLRHALSELDGRAEKPVVSLSCRPVQLHIAHSWGGGLNRWIENYLAGDESHHHLVLRSIGDRSAFGQQVAVYRGADMSVPLRTYSLVEPILSTVVSQSEYARLLDEIVDAFNVESLVISSLIGHSLDLLRTGLPTTLVMHDFFPFCPALYATFDSPCQSCDAGRVQQCRQENPVNTFFLHEPAAHWESIRRAYFSLLEQARPTIIAPSQSVFDRFTTLAPRLAPLDRHVVSHGLRDSLALHYVDNRPPDPVPGDKLRVLVLGRMSAEKGADLLHAVIPDAADVAEFVLLGAGEGGERFSDLPGCTVIDDYAMDELPRHVAAAAPDIALLLSLVPETFSFTLSELWALGVPVMATRLGAFGDRISDSHNGWLVEPDAPAVIARLRALHPDREAIAGARAVVLSQAVIKATDMVREYNALLPGTPGVPLKRYVFPRRSFQNPYLQGAGQDQAQLFRERTQGVEATYRAVLGEFLQYTSAKLLQTRRMPRFLRSLGARVFAALAKRVARR